MRETNIDSQEKKNLKHMLFFLRDGHKLKSFARATYLSWHDKVTSRRVGLCQRVVITSRGLNDVRLSRLPHFTNRNKEMNSMDKTLGS